MDQVGGQVSAIGDDERDHDLELGLVDNAKKEHARGPDAQTDRNAHAGYEDETEAGIKH